MVVENKGVEPPWQVFIAVYNPAGGFTPICICHWDLTTWPPSHISDTFLFTKVSIFLLE